MDRYAEALVVPLKVGIWQGVMQGITIGAANGVWLLSYAAAMYYGATRVADGVYTGGWVEFSVLRTVCEDFRNRDGGGGRRTGTGMCVGTGVQGKTFLWA